MANQLSVNKYRCSFMMTLETAASIKTYIKGKTVDATSVGGRGIRKEKRPMTISDFIASQIERIAKSVKPDMESMKWMRKQYELNLKHRKIADADVRAGKYRKPKSEWLKPGRVAGKKYPKIDAALAKRRNDRKRAKASNKK